MPEQTLGIRDVLDEVRLVRKDLAEYVRATAAFDASSCQRHTEKIQALESAQTAYEAAMQALRLEHTERRADAGGRWQRFGVLVALLLGVAALVVPLVR